MQSLENSPPRDVGHVSSEQERLDLTRVKTHNRVVLEIWDRLLAAGEWARLMPGQQVRVVELT